MFRYAGLLLCLTFGLSWAAESVPGTSGASGLPEPTSSDFVLPTGPSLPPSDLPPGLHDPTQPLKFHAGVGSDLKSDALPNDLELVYYQPGEPRRSFVILDGQKFSEGDVIGQGHRIKSIQRDRVILQNPEDKPIVILWSQLTIKEPVGGKMDKGKQKGKP